MVIDKSEADPFFKFINSVDPNIKFTQEECCDNKLAFLDCLVHHESNGSLSSTVYRKPTHTDHYLQFNSHHPLIHKLGVIRTLNYHADTIISEAAAIDEEKDHIQKSLNTCGYPNWAFQKAKKTKDLQPGNSVQSSTAANSTQVTIPYVACTSERIKKNFKSYGISSSFKPINTLRGKLVHVKDKQAKDKQSNVVYGLTCAEKDCKESYVGETKQSLRARVNQHRRPSSSEAQNSAVYTHIKNSGHIFNPEEVVVLDKEERWFERGVREAIWERVEQPSLNKKGGLRFLLSHAWDRALKDILRRLSHDQSTGSQTWWSPEVLDATS